MMTKYDVYEDKLEKRIRERRNAEWNRRLAYSLAEKTHEQSVRELTENLTVILGVGNVLVSGEGVKRGKSLVF